MIARAIHGKNRQDDLTPCEERTPALSREAMLLETLVELADTLVADHDPVEYLHVLAERCAAALDATAAGVLLMSGPTPELGAASSHDVRVLELFEAERREGPCIEAYEARAPVSVRDLAAATERWPAFTPKALALGYACVHSRPLRLRAERIGALSVYWSEPDRFDPADERVAKALADMASIGLTHERTLSAAHEQIHHLRRALEHRAVVEQAKILLAERLAIDPGEAFHRLRRYARDHNERLRDVAQRVLDGDLSAQHFAPD